MNLPGEHQNTHEPSPPVRDWRRFIGNQLTRSHSRRPLNHFICTKELGRFKAAAPDLVVSLRNNHNVLPVIDVPAPDGYLGTRGEQFFTALYEAVRSKNPKTNQSDVQIIKVEDISACFTDPTISYGRATHDFIQSPSEDRFGGERSAINTILDGDDTLPRVVTLFHLGAAGGDEAYRQGIQDIIVGHFKSGVWFDEDLVQ